MAKTYHNLLESHYKKLYRNVMRDAADQERAGNKNLAAGLRKQAELYAAEHKKRTGKDIQ